MSDKLVSVANNHIEEAKLNEQFFPTTKQGLVTNVVRYWENNQKFDLRLLSKYALNP
jgi:hypothetical protein